MKLAIAKILRAEGVATIPTSTDKIPVVQWKKYETQLPTEADLERWFKDGRKSMALIGGKVQCLDFDEKYSAGIFTRFCVRAEEVGLDYVLGELLRQKTPSGGFHLVWQCEGTRIRNLKLASKANNECMIETRGEGGYFLIAPSDGYTLEQGAWSSIPTITEEDRDALLDLARSFDERKPAEAPAPAPINDALTPGDDYDAKADLPALLTGHGWKPLGAGKYWTRPGKAKGVSASWDVVPGRFFVFTSSTEFQPNHVYRPWHVYAMLEHRGDYSAAAAELRRQGFGGAKKAKAAQVLPWDMVPDSEPPGVEQSPDDPPGVEGSDPHGNAPTIETEDDKIRRLLRAREFDPAKVPPPIRPIYSLGDVVICTPGNITAITAPAKVGKSALVSALTAASMTAPDSEADCLTAVGFNVDGKGLLYFDTEQSPDDFWHAVNRAKRRARLDEPPAWLKAYTVADLPAAIARRSVAISMADASAEFGGIHSVIIDGVADLVLDVNDAEECNGLVAELHGQAIRYDCSIICVIHKNPGSDKVRGHLGSQIERKAETNLSLEKDEAVTVVWSAKQRRAPIDKNKGPRFRWDDELKMHVTVTEAAMTKPAKKVLAMVTLAKSVLKPGDCMQWSGLVEALQAARQEPNGTKPVVRTVQRWVEDMVACNVLESSFGGYRLTEAAKAA